MKAFSLKYHLLVITIIALFVWAVAADIPFTFKAGDVISAEQMNQNFATLNTAKQERIIGDCSAGSSIRSIAEDGSVSCQVDHIGSGGGSGVDAINGMTGAVILQEGDNITIDDSQAGQIKISSSSTGANYAADDSSLVLNGTTFSIKDGGVSNAKLAAGAVTSSKIALPLELNGSSSTTLAVSNSGGNALSSISSNGNIGLLGRSSARGVVGTQGDLGMSCAGTYAVGGCATTGAGLYGNSVSGIGVWGNSNTRGVVGTLDGTSCAGTYAVGGCAASANGVIGRSSANDAVVGISTSPNHAGIVGANASGGFAAYFEAGTAVCSFKSGTTGWACSSDKNLKDNFQAVNPTQILESVSRMPVTTWTMKGSNVRQMGPTAQDFFEAFRLGDSDKSINNTDIQGVTLAAIQGLYQLVQEQQMKIDELENQLAVLNR